MEYNDGLINFDMEEYVAKKKNASCLSKNNSPNVFSLSNITSFEEFFQINVLRRTVKIIEIPN